MAFTFARFQQADHDSGREMPGSRALMDFCLARFGFARSLGIHKNRTIADSNNLSHHAEGRALDIGTPMIGGRADAEKGMQIVNLLGPRGEQLGIDHMIYNERIWSRRSPAGRSHGEGSHLDHVHVGMRREGARNLTGAAIAAILGSGGGAVTPTVETVDGATHVVTAVPNLNLRREPSASSGIVGSLPTGVGVARLGDATADNDGFRWIRVRARLSGSLQDGWVAEKFLQPTGSVAGPALDLVTHHVVISSGHLNMRERPTTAAGIVAELRDGTALRRLDDPAVDGDGHRWLRVQAVVAASIIDGWVASEFLKAAS